MDAGSSVAALVEAAVTWSAEDPDPGTRAELDGIVRRVRGGDEAATADLRDRFSQRLEFGTAGLRGAMGAGPNRMNSAVVRFATAGLARWLQRAATGAATRRVVVGFDARHKSASFAEEAARVLAGAGVQAHLFTRALPTPVLAFAVRHLGCDAGIMVTASHNPAADNGYKVYAGDGAQIAPPVDREISAAIAEATSLEEIALASDDHRLIERVGDDVVAAYLDAASSTPLAGPARRVGIVYTPMHGVGRAVLVPLLERCGFVPPALVAAQAEPDADFPTVAFPNPEEPGALDLAERAAGAAGADLILANDPDADRLAVAVPSGGGWRRLTGDEVGALLAFHLLSEVPVTDDRRPLVTTTVVSSRLLSRIAADTGAAYAETLTGFKWLVRPALAHPELRPVLAYEEALGYAIGELVRDKDGLTAALVVAAHAAALRAHGSCLEARLDEIAARYGLHATAQVALRYDGAGARDRLASVMRHLREEPLPRVAGRGVRRRIDLRSDAHVPEGSIAGPLPTADAVILELEGDARAVVRPSGTEPKLKVYLEVVEPPGPEGIATARAAAADVLDDLGAAMRALLDG
ncbi:MAG TPA: phospho-sugar mutase [Acidimicrobiales bacterium]|nr:phospho-sugar mutase [Acidimicrobiales bacterium]